MVTTELIDAIRSLLAGRPSSVAGEVLALAYANQCREVNARLGKIALMLEGGGEIQALQLAEQAPSVVEAALALSFGGEGAWQDYCRSHGHEVGPVVDARSLEALLAVQGKGLASNHPLYRDYRAAVSSRDDDRALNLIRVIARLNPGDENAAKELKRLQRKYLQAALTELRDSLAADGDALLAAMRKVEDVGAAEDYEKLPEWRQAADLRNRHRRVAAWQRMPELLRLAEEQLAQGEWRQAAVSHGEYGMLAGSYGYNEATAGLAERARAIGAELDQHRAEAARTAEVRHLLGQLARIAETVETQAQPPGGLAPATAAPLLDDFNRKLRQFESLHGEFPDDGTQERIEAALAQLTRFLEGVRRRKRLRLVSGLALAVAVLMAATGFGILALVASGQAALLASLRGRDAVSGVRELVRRIQSDESLLLKFSGLATEVAQAQRWLAAMDASAAIVADELRDLEDARREEFAALASPDLHAKLAAVTGLVSTLPGESGTEAAARLTLIRTEADWVLAARQQENDTDARAAVERWTGRLAQVDSKDSAAAVGQVFESAADELSPFLDLAAQTEPILRLPAVTTAMMGELEAKVRSAEQRVAAVASAQTALKQSETAAAYRAALTELAACEFAEGAAAKRVLAAWPSDAGLKAVLVFNGDQAALEAAAKDAMGPLPIPAAADARDRDLIARLTGSDLLNNLWEVEWKNGKGVKLACLSRGPVERDGRAGWKGMFAPYPQLVSVPPNFKRNVIPSAGGNILAANRPTATATLMAKLKLPELLDASGIGFRASVLPLVDRVANDTQAKPLAKAYLLSQLFRLLENHPPTEWGLHYCPGLVAEIKAFQALELKAPALESAWLLAKEPDEAKVWAEFFAARGGKWGYTEMRQTREAAAAVLQRDVELAGRAGPDGAVELTPAKNNRLVLAVCAVGEDRDALRVCGIVAARGTTLAATPAPLPFSPLLTLELADELQAALLATHAAIPNPPAQ